MLNALEERITFALGRFSLIRRAGVAEHEATRRIGYAPSSRTFAMKTRRTFPGDPRPWQVLSREYLHRKPWLTLRQDRVRLPGGNEIGEYWVSEYPDWVNVVAITRQDEIVLIRQYRHGIEGVHFELPAGVVDAEDAGPETAARRELREETGYAGGRWSHLMTISANPALQDNRVHCLLAEGVEVDGPAAHEATEDIRIHVVPIDEVIEVIDDGEMVQALNIAPLTRYLLSRRRRRDA
jgi:8-oxo-dGTP pyrophosphatase MutT (NUDIX family)